MCIRDRAEPLHPRLCLFFFILIFSHSPAFCSLSISGIPYTVAFYFSHRHFTHSVIFPVLTFSHPVSYTHLNVFFRNACLGSDSSSLWWYFPHKHGFIFQVVRSIKKPVNFISRKYGWEFVLYYHAWNSDIIPQNVKYIPSCLLYTSGCV